jgi:hypothetical protein
MINEEICGLCGKPGVDKLPYFPDPMKAAKGLPALFEAVKKLADSHYACCDEFRHMQEAWRAMTEGSDAVPTRG